ncbi:hypothetical protein C4F50_12225 [Flavobacterium sp. KB82]|uniref:DUF2726 domain-containing protein n=1 Tax=Flavobacterium hungaricum TaxID=2082725 RepID=A0ABR9TK31_9FLAO|nr:hypothetical protein [Flavobacterium hungaricum]
MAQNTFAQDEAANTKCIRKNSISEKERASYFPFAEASQVKIISFRDKGDLNEMPGQQLIRHLLSLKMGKDLFNEALYDETAVLTSEQINQLSDIIFNFSYTKLPIEDYDVYCYNPRNAIFFLDAENHIIAYIELCFGCNKYRSSDKRLSLGDYCTEKYDMIKAIFEKSHIVYGISTIK